MCKLRPPHKVRIRIEIKLVFLHQVFKYRKNILSSSPQNLKIFCDSFTHCQACFNTKEIKENETAYASYIFNKCNLLPFAVRQEQDLVCGLTKKALRW